MKTHSVGPDLLHGGVTDRWTEGRPDRHDKAESRSSQFSESA